MTQVVGRPDDVAAAEATLAKLQERQQGSEGVEGHTARFGAPDQAMTKAITKCLQVIGRAGVLQRPEFYAQMLYRVL